MRSGQSDVEVWQNLFVTFYRRGALLARVLAIAVCLCPCLCPSVCHKSGVPSKRLAELSWVFGVWELSSFVARCVFKEHSGISKNNGTPDFWKILLQHCDRRNVLSTSRIVDFSYCRLF